MNEADPLFSCPICFTSYASDNSAPMMLCMSQHFACKICFENMFKNKNKERDLIKCPFCNKPVLYSNMTPFYSLKEICHLQQIFKEEESLLMAKKESFELSLRV